MIVNGIEEKLKPLCDYLEKILKEELISQGHVATGALRDSINVAVVSNAGAFSIEGRGSKIAQYVDWGRKPGGKRVPISALLAWIRVKGISVPGKKDESLAWAIQYSIWKNGVPTNKDENKKRFVTKSLAGAKDRIKDDVKAACEYFYGVELQNIIRDVKEKMNVRN